MEKNESFYLPDCVILDVRSVASLIFLGKRIRKIQEFIPGIKIIVYHNMLKRYHFQGWKNNTYPGVYSVDDMLKQLHTLSQILNEKK